MHAPSIEDCWRSTTPELRAAIQALWQAHGAIPDPAEAERRSHEAVCVARAADGSVCAVATAQCRDIALLGQPMYYLRAFVARAARGGMLAHRMLVASMRLLAADAASAAPASSAIGIYLELESTLLQRAGQRAVWRAGPVYAGRTPQGLQRRIWYFPDAELRDPG